MADESAKEFAERVLTEGCEGARESEDGSYEFTFGEDVDEPVQRMFDGLMAMRTEQEDEEVSNLLNGGDGRR